MQKIVKIILLIQHFNNLVKFHTKIYKSSKINASTQFLQMWFIV